MKLCNKEILSSIKIVKKISEGQDGIIEHICIYDDCEYIIKSIPYETAEQYKFIQNEIKLQHKLFSKFPSNIPEIISFWKCNNTVFIIMEYLREYITLDKYLKKQNKLHKYLNIKNTPVLSSIPQFIKKLNKLNYLHGDLHTKNIMVKPNGAKFIIIDFGRSIDFNNKTVISRHPNCNKKLLIHFDLITFANDLNEEYSISLDTLRYILIPDINLYLDNFYEVNDPDGNWFNSYYK